LDIVLGQLDQCFELFYDVRGHITLDEEINYLFSVD